MKAIRKWFCAVLCGAFLVSLAGCGLNLKSEDLMKGVKAAQLSGVVMEDGFAEKAAEFTVDVFKRSLDSDENVFVSPLSMMFALGMTANGAAGETKAQMENVLGAELDSLNNSLYAVKNLWPSQKKSKLSVSNAIWFDDGFEPNKDFLQVNADYYGAAAYRAAFDSSTVKDINKWVEWKTNGMIDKIVDKLSPENIMFLVNAISFEAEWENQYEKNDVRSDTFTSSAGERQTAEFMNSTEKYIYDDEVAGFVKDYHGGDYSFAALLPKDGDIDGYIQSLSGEKLLNTINEAGGTVDVALPKFEATYESVVNEIFFDMGMSDAFSRGTADFSAIGESKSGNIFISEIRHKTFVSVFEKGTKAAAATSVTMSCSAAPRPTPELVLDRPFVYMILNNATNLPVFIGVLNSVS